ncbi:MAG: hypothetical protein A4E44_02314 [Methanosaeta sp. PtaB.Bin018]|nr:hypothetical protein [Methanothrix sp.]OPX74099.1 MAG: hypothetical protein A4E44_02314 [Methanosaeta sp. PtaB.Bin018]OPY44808.1 MAG: hypothetical protein A4E46_01406 [Methanosaeta sp. PtaU1.Bin016]
MKLGLMLIILPSLLVLPCFAEDANPDLLWQNMTRFADNLTTYTYSRTAECVIVYSNESIDKKFEAVKATEGEVNLTAKAGWWSHQLTDKGNDEVLTMQGYFVNGSEYWKEGQNWTRFDLTDQEAVMQDYNELSSQVELLNYSDLKIVGIERTAGEDCYKLTGTPDPMIVKAILGVQLFASYLGSPFPLPDDFGNDSFKFDKTGLLENSNVSLTAWVSKETSLLRRVDIHSKLTATPSILKIEEPNFKIESSLHETTEYKNFGAPVRIELPAEAQNQSFRVKGTDWRWAVFGLVEP